MEVKHKHGIIISKPKCIAFLCIIAWIASLNIVLSDNDAIFRTRGPGSSRSFRLHYLVVSRQVHSCSCLLLYLLKVFTIYIGVIIAFQKDKTLISEIIWLIDYQPGWVVNLLWLVMEPWYDICGWWRFHCKWESII